MGKGSKDTKKLDVTIGANIQEERITRGWTREEMAKKLDITHQQLMKYEKGTNRTSSSRLHEIATLFKISIVQLFEDDVEEIKAPRLQLGFFSTFNGLSYEDKKLIIKFANRMKKKGI